MQQGRANFGGQRLTWRWRGGGIRQGLYCASWSGLSGWPPLWLGWWFLVRTLALALTLWRNIGTTEAPFVLNGGIVKRLRRNNEAFDKGQGNILTSIGSLALACFNLNRLWLKKLWWKTSGWPGQDQLFWLKIWQKDISFALISLLVVVKESREKDNDKTRNLSNMCLVFEGKKTWPHQVLLKLSLMEEVSLRVTSRRPWGTPSAASAARSLSPGDRFGRLSADPAIIDLFVFVSVMIIVFVTEVEHFILWWSEWRKQRTSGCGWKVFVFCAWPDFSSPQVRLQVVHASSTVRATHVPMIRFPRSNESKRWLTKVPSPQVYHKQPC